jgi:hypothetical protein
MPGFGPRLKKVMEGVKNTIDRESRKKAAKEAAMEAEKVKIQDEKDMSNIQGAKDGGRMGYKNGSKCKMAKKGKGRAYGMNS